MANAEYILGLIANIAQVVAAGFSVAIWAKMRLQEAHLNESVQVVMKLEGEGRGITLPLALRRRDLGRAELLGRLGMLPMRQKGARFAIKAIATADFLQRLNDVVEGKSSILVIPCSSDELFQFDLEQ